MTGWQKLWQNPEIAKQWATRPPVPEVVEMADRLESEGRDRVLDIGCGMGRHTLYLAARGFDVTAIDHASAALSACRESLEQAGLEATLLPMEMTDLPFPEGSFDGAISTQVIHHARRAVIAEIIERITRQLSTHGYFVWAMPTPDHFDCGKGEEIEPGTWVDPNHREGPVPHHFCTREEVYDLLHAFEILSFRKEDTREGEVVRSHWMVLARKL
jgi:tellurite methyltransferase